MIDSRTLLGVVMFAAAAMHALGVVAWALGRLAA